MKELKYFKIIMILFIVSLLIATICNSCNLCYNYLPEGKIIEITTDDYGTNWMVFKIEDEYGIVYYEINEVPDDLLKVYNIGDNCPKYEKENK